MRFSAEDPLEDDVGLGVGENGQHTDLRPLAAMGRKCGMGAIGARSPTSGGRAARRPAARTPTADAVWSVSLGFARAVAGTAVCVLRTSPFRADEVSVISMRRHEHLAARGIGPDVQASVEGALTVVRVCAR